MRTLLRFGAVGLANTAFGFAVIAAMMLAGAGDYAANAVGYGCGLCLSFTLNRRWTFGVAGPVVRREIAAFLATAAASWLLNLVVLTAMRGIGFAGSLVAQAAGMVAYSVCFFVLSRSFVFRSGRRTS